MSAYKSLDDFVLVHRTNERGYRGILNTGKLYSSEYMSKLNGMEAECGWREGGDPRYIYFVLYKKSKIKRLVNNPIYKSDSVFYFDPKMILNYRDAIYFPLGINSDSNDNPYKCFSEVVNKEYEDMWPNSREEELALNLHNYWSLFEEWSDTLDDKFSEGILTNDFLVKVDYIPIENYIIKVEPGLKWNPMSKKWERHTL